MGDGISSVMPALVCLCFIRVDSLELAFSQVAALHDGVSQEGVNCSNDTLGRVPSGLAHGAYVCVCRWLPCRAVVVPSVQSRRMAWLAVLAYPALCVVAVRPRVGVIVRCACLVLLC